MQEGVEHILDWQPDLVIMNGDLVNRGPDSPGCWELFKRLEKTEGWLPVRGNHEEFVLHCRRRPAASEREKDLRRFADWTAQALGWRTESFETWPDHLCFHGPGHEWVHVTHGSIKGNRDGISPSVPDSALADRVPLDLSLFVTAHTHKPLQRIYGNTRILNVGSIGSPFDGDTRASYGRIEYRKGGWRTEIVRFAYDRARADREFHDSGFLEDGGPLARIIYQEWRRARLMMPEWNRRYLQSVRSGSLSLSAAVNAFLDTLD